MLLVALVRVDDGELVFEFVEHLIVFNLESAHDVFTADYQVHDAGNDNPLAILSTFITYGDYVYELHESQELLVAFWVSLKELELKLVLQIRQ